MKGSLAVARYTLVEISRRRILLVFFVVGVVGIAVIGIALKLAPLNVSMGPSGVRLQSIVRTSFPISPPPTSQSSARLFFSAGG